MTRRPEFGRLILEVDETLRDPEAMAAARRSMPVGQRDQSDSAKADTRRLVAAIAGVMGASTLLLRGADFPGWLRLGAIEAVVRWVEGDGRLCAHCPTQERPGPIMAGAWMPGTVCPLCVSLLQFPPGSVEDQMCDGCGHVCAGVGAGDPIRVVFTTFGVLTFMAGVCTSCNADLPPEMSDGH